LSVLDDDRIDQARKSLREMLDVDTLRGRSFLDVGSGSGLFSLAAAGLGAARIHSFDYDPESVACTEELKRRYAPDFAAWTIERGSVLDEAYVANLGAYDVVYSWGVLHHTGNLARALEMVSTAVAPGGKLFIALYDDRGWTSRAWVPVKRVYVSGRLGAALVAAVFVPLFILKGLLGDLGRGRNPLARYREYRKLRGMSIVHDWLDWLGGYPFEVAAPDKVTDFFARHGFSLAKIKRGRGRDRNNEFVIVKAPLEARTTMSRPS
jgi:2-polyprenyl-6-hydroxyphenyl methylase/3-demethylubiquinone-9 3-methyltransferase